MANVKITALEHLSSTQVAPEDVFVIDDVSALITRKITVSNVTRYVSNALGNAKVVEGNLRSFATYANANAAALSLAIANISANFSIAGDTGTDIVVVGVETLNFYGRNGVNTTVGANELIVSMSNTGVTPGTYGGMNGTTINVPAITVDNQGRISLAQNTNVVIDFSSIQANVNLVRSNVDSVQANVATLTTSVNTIKDNVDSVQSNVSSLTTSVNTIKANVDSVAANVTNIVNGTTAFTGNITMDRDLTISGNLVVGGATSTIQTTDTFLKDRVITISNGAAYASFDTGLYLTRGTSGNVFVGFDESAKQFIAAYTNDLAGNAVTDFTIASYANVHFNNIIADGLVNGVDIGALQTGVNGIQANINSVQSNVAAVATSVNTVQSNVATLTTSVNTKVDSVQSNVAAVVTSVNTVQSNVATLTTSVNTIKANVDSVAGNVTSITTGATAFTGNISAPSVILNTQLQIGSNATTGVGTGATTVFTFPGSIYRGVDLTLLVQDVTNSQYQLSKMLVVHNGTVVDWTEYAQLSTNNSDLTDFTASIDANANVSIISTSGSANKKITVSAQYIIQ